MDATEEGGAPALQLQYKKSCFASEGQHLPGSSLKLG